MYLIIGLGNPGEKYQKTRHNVGFVAVDELAEKADAGAFKASKKNKSEVARAAGAILAKPQTFMNSSGEAVAALLKFYNVDAKNIIVICDDSNLELGQARVRFSGSDGGHKGLQSVISAIGADFWRVRIGIGQNQNMPLEVYVLKNISPDEFKKIKPAIDMVGDLLIESISKNDLENQTIN